MRTLASRDRFVGCLLGGAAGDALGAPVEFLAGAARTSVSGPSGVTEFLPAYGRIGAITDDTQMALFTAEGLLRGLLGRANGSVDAYSEHTARAYARWLMTQGYSPARSLRATPDGWLYAERDLHADRAPGSTCVSALERMTAACLRARNDSKGCGGVMRMAPAGLFAWHWRDERGLDWAFDLGAALAALTHGHPTGSLTAGAFAVLIVRLVDGVPLADALKAARACLRRRPHHGETLDALVEAERLAASATGRDTAIAQLGGGWVAEEALAIAVYAALVADDLRGGVILAVNHDGDSDSTGAIAGNLLGAMHGASAIPASWLEALELRDVIAEMAGDLYDCAGWRFDDFESARALARKYPRP
jgi:ADP-ribosylglycohydrolase